MLAFNSGDDQPTRLTIIGWYINWLQNIFRIFLIPFLRQRPHTTESFAEHRSLQHRQLFLNS